MIKYFLRIYTLSQKKNCNLFVFLHNSLKTADSIFDQYLFYFLSIIL